jgi:hypothetical protein
LLNLALLGYLIAARQNNRRIRVEVSPVSNENAAESNTVLIATTPARESKSFNWSEIESTDYRTYIANLRGIGCPEQTIRDIITADVNSMFAERREKFRRSQQLQSTGELAEKLARQSLDSALKELADDERQLLKTLLEPEGSVAPVPANTLARLRLERMRRTPASMPLALENVDLPRLGLNEDQTRLITALRENFVKEIGGYNQDPNDPAYRERWQKAQSESDEVLHAMLGNRAYQDYQLLIPGTSATDQP